MDPTTMAFHPLPITTDLSSPLSSVPSSASSDSDLSELSNSPTPPPEFVTSFASRPSYPSPSSSRRSSAKTSPAPENMATPTSSHDEDPRPRKKRKVADPKERTTERIDFTNDLTDADKPQLQRLLNVLHKKRKIVVIAGAGISVSAGIPDFRSSTGLFKSLRKEHKLKSSGKDLFNASVYQDDSATSSFHDMVRTLSQQTKSAQPTAFHHLLATLAQDGRLMRLYTQNVDGIDTALPPLKTQVPLPKKAPWPKTIQVHGSLDHMVCSKCNSLSDFDAEIFVGAEPPACPNCVENDSVRQVAEKRSHGIGKLRPRMVLYNEHNPDDEAIGSCATTDIRHRPDAVIVVGTTLKVPGVRRIVREMCATVRDRRDGVTIWINNDPEPLGKDLANAWDLVIKGPADEVARHAAMRKWDDPMEYKEVTDEDLIKAKGGQKAEVVIGTPKKATAIRTAAGQLTPGASPRMVPQTTIKQEADSQPTTPSKKGTKRKSDAQITLHGKIAAKAPPKKATQKKAAGEKARGRKKEAKKDTQPINNVFKTSKASTRPAAKRVDKPSAAPKFVPSKYNATAAIHDVIPVNPNPVPMTPKHRDAQVTKVKSQFAMAPLSSSDPRNNHSPTRPEVEGFTPVKPRTLSHSMDEPSQQLLNEAVSYLASPTSNSRPSTAGSQKYEIERVDPERIPNGMASLIH